MYSLQIFVFNTGMMNGENNFPLLYFNTLKEKYDFIRNLTSIPRQRLDKPYFVLNNPQLLPENVRYLHAYEAHLDPLDSPQQGANIMDGIFTIKDNVYKFKNFIIDNNTREETGFVEYINNL
jgi:hypothetical protein